MDDAKRIWQSVNWNGKYKPPNDRSCTPTDIEFAKHFSELLNAADATELQCPSTNIYIPILDDPISTAEVDASLRGLHSSKSAGPDGVPPGILKFLPPAWITLLTFLLNLAFSGSYPVAWCYAKFFTIFKKGNPQEPANYRGISILNACCKVYDSVLQKRFIKWYSPSPEQAGAQTGRGCIEQILCLRLLIDYARHSKQTLYITFIDYTKAYDRVNRQLLLNLLANKGCGQRFLDALTGTLKHTANVIGNACFDATAGVRQGGSCSCSLFTLYVDEIVKAINSYGQDGFLNTLHCLLLMDDTTVLATSRAAMTDKLELLHSCAERIGMEIHPDKSQFIVINSADVAPFFLNGLAIRHTPSYTYLGTPISNKSMREQIIEHVTSKQKHVRKYLSFLNRNSDAPFCVKRKVLESALTSAILYSAETWFAKDLSMVRASYLSSVKALLGVRVQTHSDLIYAELGIPAVDCIIRKRQLEFLSKIRENASFNTLPVKHAIDLAVSARCPMGLYLIKLDSTTDDPIQEFTSSLRDRITEAGTTRLATYVAMNPNLAPHPIYSTPLTVPEPHRISLTRLRLSSHHLRIETGRWSRTPREERLCECQDSIQTEEHVLLYCRKSAHIRSRFPLLNFSSVPELMQSRPETMLCKFTFDIIRLFSE
jgi:hypothetical protein